MSMRTYQEETRPLTDREIEVLSDALRDKHEAFVSGDEENQWDDVDAESLYHELRAEAERRRWESLTPEQRAAEEEFQKIISGETLKMLERNIVFASMFNRNYDLQFGEKIGQVMQVKIPERINR